MDSQQIKFFQAIGQSLPDYQNLAQSVAEVLAISTNEAYKKVRGISNLSLPQLIKLSDAFGVPFAYQPKELASVSFNYLHIDREAPNMLAYLQDLLQNLKAITQQADKHIIIATDDIPIFHFFKYPELTCFKLFFWADNPAVKFDHSAINDEIVAVARELNSIYLDIPSTEIWANDAVYGTLDQVRYAFEAGHIADKALAEKIVEQVRYCLTDMNMYAIGAKKTIDPKHSFTWYTCDVLGSLAYLIEFKESMLCYNRFNTFNYLKTDDHPYCKQTKEWMQGLIRKSVAFSGQGEKYRNKFLYTAFAACDKLIRAINEE
jgi:transcriptional regulator with XRE-family HTH domain